MTRVEEPTHRERHRQLDTYLLPGERVVTEIRHHGIVLVKPALILLAATALALWLDISVDDAGRSVLPVTRVLWLGVAGWFAWQVLEWRHQRFVATDKRIMLLHGFITRKVSMMPLTKVTDMSYHRSILGRILGYGEFVLESAGQDQALSNISFVPQPDAHYRAIVAEIFGLGAREDLEDDVDGDDLDDVVDVEHDDALPPREGTSIYRSEDLRRRRYTDETGELPPYDPDWRP